MEKDELIRSRIAGKLKTLRKKERLTMKEASKALDLSIPQYSRIESEFAYPTIVTVTRASLFYNLSLDELVLDKKGAKKPKKRKNPDRIKVKLKELDGLEGRDHRMLIELLDLLVVDHKLREMKGKK